MKKVNYIFVLASVLIVTVLGIGISYSLWNISVSQDKVNTAMTSCFDITYSSESNAINLEKQYPISDEAGSKLTPYTFKITNNCDIDAYYKINLETLNTSNIDTRFIKSSLNNTNPQVINRYNETEVSLKNGKVANTLKSGYLPGGGSISFDLRVLLDYDTTIDDIKNDGTDKWVGKIVLISSPVTEDEINKACQEKGGDLIDSGECRKYYANLNNIVNMEYVAFGNVNDGKPINHLYDPLSKSYTITYKGVNKWFGTYINDVKEKYSHVFFGSFISDYNFDGLTIEFCNYNSNTNNCAYRRQNVYNAGNYFSYYVQLTKYIDINKITSYNTYLIYYGFMAITDDTLSKEYKLSDYKIIDLTLMFGEGNEPSREWCDKYLTNYYEYNEEGTLTPIKEIGEPIKTSYYDKIDMFD